MQQQQQQQQQQQRPPRRNAKFIPLPNKQFAKMNKAEIASVIKLQLNHLSSSDPLADDFYSQVYNARKGKVNPSVLENTTAFWNIFQFKNDQARNPDGTPRLMKSTLGRIAASNLRKPRSIMSLTASDAETAETAGGSGPNAATMTLETEQEEGKRPAKTFMFSSFSVVYLIEQGIRCVMNLEDCDSLLASLAPQPYEAPGRMMERDRLQRQRSELVMRLAESLDVAETMSPSLEHPVCKFILKSTGRLLIYRALLLMPAPFTYQLAEQVSHVITPSN